MSTTTLQSLRHKRPITTEGVCEWVRGYTGVRLAATPVCRDHVPPGRILADKFLTRPPITLTHGPRGGGKSFGAAIRAHMDCRFNPRFGVKILGGSLAQSRQVYNALKESIWQARGLLGSDSPEISQLLKTVCEYRNGAAVEILPASALSVRGPHVPQLVLDEIDELDDELRQAAMGMAMKKHGVSSSVDMLSTWHKIGGPMADMIQRAESGEFPLYRFCVFDVLETCDASRSGNPVESPDLFENCPQCPIKKWCHSEVVEGLPKAKRSRGHYAIQSLIDKVATVSLRTFESDYLCLGPIAHGLWFTRFDSVLNVDERLKYDPSLPLHLGVDSGKRQGAIFLQIGKSIDGRDEVRVLADYWVEDEYPETTARRLREIARQKFGDRIHHASVDLASETTDATGRKAIGLYKLGGLHFDRRWPRYPGSVNDGLVLIDSFVESADSRRGLKIHPDCKRTIQAFQAYSRKKVRGIWLDVPEDPQHPHEEIMDCLRGVLMLAFPEGRAEPKSLPKQNARQVF